MAAKQTWNDYEAAYKAVREQMGAFVNAVAQEFGASAEENTHNEDYGYCANFTCNGKTYFAELQLWDAAAFGDAEPGEQGNLHLSVCRDGGQIVIGWAPHNYIDKCWVPYTDLDELRSRVPAVSEAQAVVDAIHEDANA